MKTSITDNDLIVQVDFTKCYKYYQQDAIQSAYFENQCFSIFTACCYFSVDGKINESNVMHCKYYENCTYGVMEWGLSSGSGFFGFFELLKGIVLPNNLLTWFYIECHHGKGYIDGTVCILFFYLAYT